MNFENGELAMTCLDDRHLLSGKIERIVYSALEVVKFAGSFYVNDIFTALSRIGRIDRRHNGLFITFLKCPLRIVFNIIHPVSKLKQSEEVRALVNLGFVDILPQISLDSAIFNTTGNITSNPGSRPRANTQVEFLLTQSGLKASFEEDGNTSHYYLNQWPIEKTPPKDKQWRGVISMKIYSAVFVSLRDTVSFYCFDFGLVVKNNKRTFVMCFN